MATFTINFNAQYPGEHRIGYRDYTYPANTYDNIDITVNTPGSQSVEISIPHNLYCATKGVTFNCYVVAFCQNNGYVYYGTPWFGVSSSSGRSLALNLVSNSLNSSFRIGQVQIQFKT